MVECYFDSDGDRVCYRSAWESWARWLFTGLAVLFFFLVFFFFSCISARRRRRRGQIPFRGTGWLANHGPAVYNPNPYPSGGGHSTTTGTTTTGTTGGYNPNAAQRPVPQTGAAASYYANYAPPPPMYSPNPNATDGGTTTTNTTGGNTQYTEQQNGRIELMGPQPTYSATK